MDGQTMNVQVKLLGGGDWRTVQCPQGSDRSAIIDAIRPMARTLLKCDRRRGMAVLAEETFAPSLIRVTFGTRGGQVHGTVLVRW